MKKFLLFLVLTVSALAQPSGGLPKNNPTFSGTLTGPDGVFSNSLTLLGGTAPTTSSAGQFSFDTNAWASGRGAIQLYDGTANTYLIGVLASDTPTNGQVPVWNTGGTITWETPSGSGTVTSVAASVPSFLSIAGSPVTTSGTLAITYSGTALPVVNGGTGQTSYTNGQLLIGNTTGNTLTKATLTGTGNQVIVTNGGGTITLSTPQDIGTASNPQFATLELGAASDTTLSRVSAGVIAVEGVTVPTISSTNTLTNKRLTARVTAISSSATPTVNTDACDCVTITALAAAITSMTTNLSGTPVNFDQLEYRILDDGTARAITWGSAFTAGPVALPTTTTISKLLHVYFEYNTVTSKWECQYSANDL